MSENRMTKYETVAANLTDQALGATGKAGDYLERLIITVATAATGTVDLQDGDGTAFAITAANTPIGVYTVEIGARSTGGAWKVTTGAGATVVAIGMFS